MAQILTAQNLMYIAAEFGQYASWLDAYYYANGAAPDATVDDTVARCSSYAVNLSRAAASLQFRDAQKAIQLLTDATSDANKVAQKLSQSVADVTKGIEIGTAFLALGASLSGLGGTPIDGIIGLVNAFGGDSTDASNTKTAGGP
jgi:hypothetical protein